MVIQSNLADFNRVGMEGGVRNDISMLEKKSVLAELQSKLANLSHWGMSQLG